MIKVDKYVKGLKVVRGPDWYYSDQDGGAGNVGVVTKLQSSTGYVQVIWSNGRDDNYRIGSNGKYDLALANEADAHLLGHSTSSEPTVESLKAMFPPGTKFIPINETTEYKVYKSWKFDVNSRGDYCFINSNDYYAHNGYLYEKSTGKYAEIVTPTETLALPSSIIASKIPKEGAVHIAHFSDTELEALLKVIVSRIGSHHSDKTRTSEHKHLAWTQNSYWYTINTTSKTFYSRSQFFDEPVEEELLKYGDIVVFDGPNGPRKYSVADKFLAHHATNENDAIFNDLGVDKYQLARKMYGYPSHTEGWPEFITKDYKAATNLVNELHRLCAEARSSAPTQSNSKTTISYEQEKHPRDRSISFQPKSVILQGDDIKISRVQAVRASGVRCSAGEIKCRSGHSY